MCASRSLKFRIYIETFGFISGGRETITIITFVIEYMIRTWHDVEMKCSLCVYKYMEVCNSLEKYTIFQFLYTFQHE